MFSHTDFVGNIKNITKKSMVMQDALKNNLFCPSFLMKHLYIDLIFPKKGQLTSFQSALQTTSSKCKKKHSTRI
jgi:hypothetical protein